MATKKKITKKAEAEKLVSPKIKRKNKKGAGRPRAKIEKYFDAIEPFLQNGFSINEACQHANIPHQTVSDYMQKDPKFSARIEVAKRTMELAALNNVGTAIRGGSVQVSQWLLERKRKDEYSTRTENINENHDGEIVLLKIPENGREGGQPNRDDKKD